MHRRNIIEVESRECYLMDWFVLVYHPREVNRITLILKKIPFYIFLGQKVSHGQTIHWRKGYLLIFNEVIQ